ncbi:MAG: hypothetical protein U0452_11190 [Anaerolineae bacterium]
MKKLLILGIILVLVLTGGALTSYMLANNSTVPVPVLTTTVDPDASTTMMLGWKAEQLFILVSFLIFNLIGIAVTVALVIWYFDRGIQRSRIEKSLAGKEGEAEPARLVRSQPTAVSHPPATKSS